MKVENIVYVIGRGNIVCSHLETNEVIHIKDNIKINDNIFDITGIEMWEHSKDIGLILKPNDLVKEKVNINDTIEIVKCL